MAKEAWGQVFQLDERVLQGESPEHFFRVTLLRRPRGRFNYLKKAPGARKGIRLLFQFEASIVATAILLAKRPRDGKSDKDSDGFLELEAPLWIEKPISHDAFTERTGLALSSRMHLLRDQETWFLRTLGVQ